MLRLALLIGAGWWLYNQATKFNDALRYSFSNLKLNFSPQTPHLTTLTADMGIENPTATSVTIQAFAGTAYIQGKAVATFSGQGPFTIAPNGKTVVTIWANLVNASLAGSLAQLIKVRSLPTIQFKGKLITTLGTIPFNYTAVEGATT